MNMDPESLVVINDEWGKGLTVNFDRLSDTDEDAIPKLIRKFNTVMRFPEKVSNE